MTIDASTGDQSKSAHPVPDKSNLPELIRRNTEQAVGWVSARGGEVRDMEPIYIGGLIRPLQTEGAYGGVNKSMISAHALGLLIEIPAYQNMQANDWIKVYWGDDKVAVTSGGVLPEQVGKPVPMAVLANHVPEGINSLWYLIERAGGGNSGEGTPIDILVRTQMPGGIDPEPDVPNHQGMPPAEIDVPESGIIDDDAAKEGVKVTFEAYPNMREYDLLRLSWSGVIQEYQVTPADVAARTITMVVTEETILAAGDGDNLVVVYEVLDEVHNRSSDWSMRAHVSVEVGDGLLTAPLIQNPDPDADPADVIDLEKLGEDDLTVSVWAMAAGELQRDDVVTLTWVGTTSQGQEVIVTPEPRTVISFPAILNFIIPNADLLGLARGRGHASYEVTRGDSSAGVSKRAFVSFHGVEKGLPKPTVEDAVHGTLDPALDTTTVTVPGAALELNDHVTMVWLGTRADGSVLLHSVGRPVSGAGVGKPMNFTIDGPEHIAVLDGGSVSVYYRLYKYKLDRELTSDSELLMVGESQSTLPAPVTRPSADSGFIEPDDLPGGQLVIIVAPYAGMKVGQTVRLVWKASLGPAYDDWMEVTPPLEGKEVPFYMDRSTVEQYRDATVELAYQIEEPGVPSRLSSPVTFTVGVKDAALPPPELPQAVDGVLNPADASDGAIVRVPVEAGLAFGDDVEVSWTGDKQGGVTKKSELVHEDDVGKPFDVIIDYQYVVANNDGNVVVSYQVFQGGAGGGAPISDPQTVRVQGAALPLPVIRQAENGELNPDDVLQGATVVIDASAQLKDGDVVLLRVTSPANGGSTTVPHVVAPGDGGKQVELTIEYGFINASNGVSIDLEYEITRAAGGGSRDVGRQQLPGQPRGRVRTLEGHGRAFQPQYLPRLQRAADDPRAPCPDLGSTARRMAIRRRYPVDATDPVVRQGALEEALRAQQDPDLRPQPVPFGRQRGRQYRHRGCGVRGDSRRGHRRQRERGRSQGLGQRGQRRQAPANPDHLQERCCGLWYFQCVRGLVASRRRWRQRGVLAVGSDA